MSSEIAIPRHASSFVEGFFAADAARIHVLVAEPQTGAVTMILEIMAHGARGGGRGLFVVPHKQLGLQAMDRLRQVADHVPVRLVDGPTFRELDARSEGDPFRETGIFIVTFDLIAGPAFDAVLATRWSVVVLDAAVPIGHARAAICEALLRSPEVARVCMRVDLRERVSLLSDAALNGAHMVEWRAEDLRDAEGRSLVRAVRMRVVDYTRSMSEVSLLNEVRAALGDDLRGAVLLRAALSSPVALERALRNMLDRLVATSAGPPNELDVEAEPVSSVGAALCRALLHRLDELATDSKLEALVRVVAEVLPGDRGAVVFVSHVATVQYLHAALIERGHRSYRLPDLVDGEAATSLQEHRERGGVLLATVSRLQGIEVRADVAIHYDRPSSPLDYYVRNSRLRGDRAIEASSIILRDTSDVGLFEAGVSLVGGAEWSMSPVLRSRLSRWVAAASKETRGWVDQNLASLEVVPSTSPLRSGTPGARPWHLHGVPAAGMRPCRMFVVDDAHPDGDEVSAHFTPIDGILWDLERHDDRALVVLVAGTKPIEGGSLDEVLASAGAHVDAHLGVRAFGAPRAATTSTPSAPA